MEEEGRAPHLDVDQLLGGPHAWHDVQDVFQTTFQALYNLANAQSSAVRELERKLGEMRERLAANINRKADDAEVKAAVAVASMAREAAELASQRVEEESSNTQEAQRSIMREAQALRAGLKDLRAAVEKQRADVQQWRVGFEAGLSRFVAEFARAAPSVKDECKVALTQEVESVQQEIAHLKREVERLSIALNEKATSVQLQEFLREAWQREENHLARVKRVCESKVSTADFATLAALAEGKVSMVDLDLAVQRLVQRSMGAVVSEQQLLTCDDVTSIAESVASDARERLNQCEHRIEELAWRQQRTATAAEELRAVASSKLEPAEVEARIAGALADWVRAAQQSADAVQAAMWQGRAVHEEFRHLGPERRRSPQQDPPQTDPFAVDAMTLSFAAEVTPSLFTPSEFGSGFSECSLDATISQLSRTESEGPRLAVPTPSSAPAAVQPRVIDHGSYDANSGARPIAATPAAATTGVTTTTTRCSSYCSGSSLPAPRGPKSRNHLAPSSVQGVRRSGAAPRLASAAMPRGRSADRSRLR